MNNQHQSCDILLQHPLNTAINEGSVSRTNKGWANAFEPLKKDYLKFQHYTNQDGVRPSWDQLLKPCSDDELRRARITHEPNRIAGYILRSETDVASYFNVECVNPVLSKFIDFPRVYCNMEKTAERAGHIVDVSFSPNVMFTYCCNETKKNTINPEVWLGGTFEQSKNDLSLSRELRGYAYEYQVPGIGCFDGSHFLWLEFQAKNVEDIKSPDCHVNAWLFAHRDTFRPHPSVPVYFLRDALYRFIVQGIRRFQCRNYPLPCLDGIQAVERQYFSGLPLWKVDSQITTSHPKGYYRDTDEDGRLCWKHPNGAWLEIDGELVPDSWALRDYETHAPDFM